MNSANFRTQRKGWPEIYSLFPLTETHRMPSLRVDFLTLYLAHGEIVPLTRNSGE